MTQWLEPNTKIMTLLQLSLPVQLYWAFTIDASWHWWIAAFVFYFLYCAVGNNVGLHRYFCHKQFEMHKYTEWFVLWCSTMSGLGSPQSYTLPHLVHHRYSDEDNDPHGPTAGKRSVLYYYHRHTGMRSMTVFGKRLAELCEKYSWLHKYYWGIVALNAGLMYAIDVKVFLFCWLLPATLTLWAVALTIYLQHEQLPDGTYSASNTQKHSWWGLGEGLHLNHHLNPKQFNNAINPGEVDYTWHIAKLFARKQ